jgi:hypothetical protein
VFLAFLFVFTHKRTGSVTEVESNFPIFGLIHDPPDQVPDGEVVRRHFEGKRLNRRRRHDFSANETEIN